MVRFLAALSLAAALTLVRAQSQPSACAIQCASESANSATCASFSDLQCVCSNEAYQEAVSKCVKETCPKEQAAITKFGCDSCANIHVSEACKAAEVPKPAHKPKKNPSPSHKPSKPKHEQTHKKAHKAHHAKASSKPLSCPEECAVGNLKFTKCKETDIACLCSDKNFTARVGQCIKKKGCSYSSIAQYSKLCKSVGKKPSHDHKKEEPKKKEHPKEEPKKKDTEHKKKDEPKKKKEPKKKEQPKTPAQVIPECAVTCAYANKNSTKCELTDEACLCKDTRFQAAYVTCVDTHCSKQDASTTKVEGAALCKKVLTPPSTNAPGKGSKPQSPSNSTTHPSKSTNHPSDTPAPSYPKCGVDCLSDVIGTSKCKITDAPCLCKDAGFQAAYVKCLGEKCSAKDKSETIALGIEECKKSAGVVVKVPVANNTRGDKGSAQPNGASGVAHNSTASVTVPAFGKGQAASNTTASNTTGASTVPAASTNTSAAPTLNTSAYPACAQPCFAVGQSKSNTTCASNDAACLCQDQNYQSAFGACVSQACSSADLNTTITTGTAQCTSIRSGGSVNSISSGTNTSSGTNATTHATTSAAQAFGVSSGLLSIVVASVGIAFTSILF